MIVTLFFLFQFLLWFIISQQTKTKTVLLNYEIIEDLGISVKMINYHINHLNFLLNEKIILSNSKKFYF